MVSPRLGVERKKGRVYKPHLKFGVVNQSTKQW